MAKRQAKAAPGSKLPKVDARHVKFCRIEFKTTKQGIDPAQVPWLLDQYVMDGQGAMKRVYVHRQGTTLRGLVLYISQLGQIEMVVEQADGSFTFDVAQLADNERLGTFGVFVVDAATGRGVMTKYHGDRARTVLQEAWMSICLKKAPNPKSLLPRVEWTLKEDEPWAILAAAKQIKSLTIPFAMETTGPALRFHQVSKSQSHKFSFEPEMDVGTLAHIVQSFQEEEPELYAKASASYVDENENLLTLDFDKPVVPTDFCTMRELLNGERLTEATVGSSNAMKRTEQAFNLGQVQAWVTRVP